MTNNIPQNTPDAFSSAPSHFPTDSTRKNLAEVMNYLEITANGKMMHSLERNSLCRTIQQEIGSFGQNSQLSDEDYRTISNQINNLSSNCQSKIRQLIVLNQSRKKKLDAAILDAKSLSSLSRKSRESLRSKMGNALRETKELQHEIALHQTLLQLRTWMVAPLSENRHFNSDKSDYQLEELECVIKTRQAWGKKIIDMLRNVPGEFLLGFKITGAVNTYGLLMLAIEKYTAIANLRMEIIVQNFKKTKVSSKAGFDVQPEVFSRSLPSHAIENSDNIQQYRDAITFLDGKVYYSELLLTVSNDFTRLARSYAEPSFNLRAKIEQIEADSLALHYGHSIIEAQRHIPSRIARHLEMSEDFASHLINKVTENLHKLSMHLKKALEQVPSNDPDALMGAIRYRAWELMTNQKINWKTFRKPDESSEEYRLLQHCLPAFRKASNHLDLLALRVARETKGASKARAVNTLEQLACDLRMVTKQIDTYMGELTNFDVKPETLGESEISKAAAQELQDIDWSQSPLFVDEEEKAPQNEAIAAMPEKTKKIYTKEKASANVDMTNSQIKRQEKTRLRYEKLGELATQQFSVSQDILNRLKAGDTRESITAGHVEITLKSAIEFKKQQLALLPDNPGLKKNIQRLEAGMNDRIAEAISLRPTQQAVQNALEKGMSLTVTRPVILDITRENDFVHEYVFSLQGFKFKLHAHYSILNAGPDQKPEKVHFKRMDERGTDNEGNTSYYLDDRLVRTAFRSREAKEGIAIARRFLGKNEWLPAKAPSALKIA